MNHKLVVVTFLASVSVCLASCHATVEADTSATSTKTSTATPNTTRNQMKIKIGTQTFKATLNDNATATAFKALLPMTVTMTELNGNEKYADLERNLPVSAAKPATIRSGDLMMYGANTLVLSYKTFPTSYSYTNLGHIEDSTGLVDALGAGSVTVTFELE